MRSTKVFRIIPLAAQDQEIIDKHALQRPNPASIGPCTSSPSQHHNLQPPQLERIKLAYLSLQSQKAYPRSRMAASRLLGKTILITGASSGIGRSTALHFARASPSKLQLILTARRLDRLQQLSREIQDEVGSGVRVLARQLDVSKPEQVRDLLASLPEEFRGVDVLVNNA
jgi:3-hydroxy acid dehydrogenase / malonic semialdehyde reductase